MFTSRSTNPDLRNGRSNMRQNGHPGRQYTSTTGVLTASASVIDSPISIHLCSAMSLMTANPPDAFPVATMKS